MFLKPLLNIFNQPFPHNTSWKSSLKTAAGFGVFIAVFLLIFRPFGLDTVSMVLLVKSSSAFGFVALACIFVTNILLETFFPAYVNEKKWTTGKQIINVGIVIMLIGLVNYLVASLLFNIHLTWKNAFRYQGIALSVGLLPVTIYTLYVKNRWLRQFKQEASELQKKLEEKREAEKKKTEQPETTPNDTIVFEAANEKDKLSVQPDKLVYIEAASNYMKVFFERKDMLSYSIVRMTMKKAAELTEPYSMYFRCHRAFIVNLDKIERVEGNAQGYKLKLQGVNDLIPVSRNLNSEFSDRLLAFRKESPTTHAG